MNKNKMRARKRGNSLQEMVTRLRLGDDDKAVLWTICGRTKSGGQTAVALGTLTKQVGISELRIGQSIRVLCGLGFVRILDEHMGRFVIEPNSTMIRRHHADADGQPLVKVPEDRGRIDVTEVEHGLNISVQFSTTPKTSSSGKMLELASTAGFRKVQEIRYDGREMFVSVYVGVKI